MRLDHVLDELRNACNPAEARGLPRASSHVIPVILSPTAEILPGDKPAEGLGRREGPGIALGPRGLASGPLQPDPKVVLLCLCLDGSHPQGISKGPWHLCPQALPDTDPLLWGEGVWREKEGVSLNQAPTGKSRSSRDFSNVSLQIQQPAHPLHPSKQGPGQISAVLGYLKGTQNQDELRQWRGWSIFAGDSAGGPGMGLAMERSPSLRGHGAGGAGTFVGDLLRQWRGASPPPHPKSPPRASLVAQWLRICLLMQGTRVRALVWEDPTCRGATRPVSHNY